MSHDKVISESAIAKIEALREIICPDDNIVMWKEPFDPGLLFNKVFSQKEKRTGLFKPDGIWYACGFDWLDWVLSEMPQWAHRECNLAITSRSGHHKIHQSFLSIVRKEVHRLQGILDRAGICY